MNACSTPLPNRCLSTISPPLTFDKFGEHLLKIMERSPWTTQFKKSIRKKFQERTKSTVENVKQIFEADLQQILKGRFKTYLFRDRAVPTNSLLLNTCPTKVYTFHLANSQRK